MNINKNFIFGCSIFSCTVLFWSCSLNNQYESPWQFPSSWWQVAGVFLLCQPWKIGKNIYSIFGGINPDGAVVSLIGVYQKGTMAFSLVAFFQNATKESAGAVCIIGLQKAEEHLTSLCCIGVQISKEGTSLSIVGIVEQKAGGSAVVFFGVCLQEAGMEAVEGIGIAIQKANIANTIIGVSIQIAQEKAWQGAGVRLYASALKITRPPFATLLLDIATPKKATSSA